MGEPQKFIFAANDKHIRQVYGLVTGTFYWLCSDMVPGSETGRERELEGKTNNKPIKTI